MKTLKFVLPLFILALVISSCKKETTIETKTVEISEATHEKVLNPNANYLTASFGVEGMKCAMGCAKVIEKNLFALDGVKEAVVDFDSKTATVTYDEALVNKESLTASVTATSNTYTVISWENKTQPIEKTMEEL
ncbi:MAG: heavy metal transporter [Bacteroidetes bacterium HGW-Bacteroidetes-2]|jgi:Cu+-exporting ATPase|nr:MAG: heavy metal transporter [Bacteroidetes bacterium HGW-Bacteroidetes-2]